MPTSQESVDIEKNHLDTTLNTITDTVLVLDSNRKIIYANLAAAKSAGFDSVEEFMSQPMSKLASDFEHKDEFGNMVTHDQYPTARALKGITVKDFIIQSINKKTKQETWHIASAVPVLDAAGSVDRVVVSTHDITKTKQVEEDLKRAEQSHRLALESAKMITWEWNPTTEEITASPNLKEIYGVDKIESSTHGFSLLHPDDRERHSNIVENAVKRAEMYRSEFRIIRPDNKEVIWLEERGVAIPNSKGKVDKVVGVVLDITHRKKIESEKSWILAELRSEKLRIDNVIATVPGVVWELMGNPKEGNFHFDFVSKHIEQMLGYSAQDWLSDPSLFLSIVHPADREKILDEIDAIFKQGSVGTTQFRRMAKDGRILWVESHITPIFEGKEPIGLRGVSIDITLRKRAEETQKFLAEASSLLSQSLDYELTLKKVAELAVPNIATWCAVHILGEDGSLNQLAVAHEDPSKLKWAEKIRVKFPTDPNAPQGLPQVIRSATSELYHEIPDEMLVKASKDVEHLEILRQLGMKSIMMVPIVLRGKSIGAISFISAELGYLYDESDLLIAENLAARAAIAIENSQLYQKSQKEIEVRKKIEQEIISSLQEKEILLKEIHHRVKNNLQVISSLLNLQSRTIKNEEALRIFREGEARIRSIALVHEQLYKSQNLKSIRVDEYINNLMKMLLGSYGVSKDRIHFDIRVEKLLLEIDSLIACGLILNELVSNSLKYAFPNQRKGSIKIEFTVSDDQAKMIVSDDGVGLSNDFNIETSDTLGMRLVKTLISQLDGTLQIRNGRGTTFEIVFPMEAHNGKN